MEVDYLKQPACLNCGSVNYQWINIGPEKADCRCSHCITTEELEFMEEAIEKDNSNLPMGQS